MKQDSNSSCSIKYLAVEVGSCLEGLGSWPADHDIVLRIENGEAQVRAILLQLGDVVDETG